MPGWAQHERRCVGGVGTGDAAGTPADSSGVMENAYCKPSKSHRRWLLSIRHRAITSTIFGVDSARRSSSRPPDFQIGVGVAALALDSGARGVFQLLTS